MINKATTIFLILFLASLNLTGLSQDIRVDHVITVVADLDSAILAYEALGFTVKKGRLHENGLLNAHIKFNNGTSLELMSVVGEPTDEIAKEYASLLRQGESGVYLALTGMPVDELASRLDGLDTDYTITKSKNWDYLTFPGNSRLAHIFFINYHVNSNDSPEILTHNNSAQGIASVWIEGEEEVKALLDGLGLMPVRLRSDPKFGASQGYGVMAGNIIVIPAKNPKQRPRVKGISFGNQNGSESLIIRY